MLIRQAMESYRGDNDGFFPFDERGPLHSLALLYTERLVTDARAFVCPAVPMDSKKRKVAAVFPADTVLAGAPCDYGFTWHVPKNCPGDFVILADMPQNHTEGKQASYNVLHYDSKIEWTVTPFCSQDPHDNIFAPEPGWSPDTDSWIRQK